MTFFFVAFLSFFVKDKNLINTKKTPISYKIYLLSIFNRFRLSLFVKNPNIVSKYVTNRRFFKTLVSVIGITQNIICILIFFIYIFES